MEGRVVDSSYDLSCGFVAQLQEVWEVILTESSIVGEEPVFTLLPLGIGLLFEERSVGNGLHLLAALAPKIVSLFFLCYCCHDDYDLLCLQLSRLFDAHLLGDIHILVLVDDLHELRRYCGVGLRAVFEPLGESHEDLDGVDDVSLFVEFLDYS